MLIGIPREIKDGEGRVGATPEMVHALVQGGHSVVVERGAGELAGFSDAAYQEQGATLAPTPQQVYEASCILKVKEPQEGEWRYLRRGQILFSFLHLAAVPRLERFLKEEGVLAVAYEEITDERGDRVCLAPMSAMAGQIAVLEGAHLLGVPRGGKGVLITGAHVLVLGGGVAGSHAVQLALGMGAKVTVLDKSEGVLSRLKRDHPSIEVTRQIRSAIGEADLVIGAVLCPGKQAPKLVTREMMRGMEPGSVFVDIAIDQGGCAETSKPTAHSEPTYIEEGVLHYCVPNMPGAYPKTGTEALCVRALPYVLQLMFGASQR